MIVKIRLVIITFLLISCSSVFSTESVLVPEKNSPTIKVTPENYDEMRKKVDDVKLLYAEINKEIASIELVHKSIEHIIKNKNQYVTCQLISSLKKDIDGFHIKIKNEKNNNTQKKLQNHENSYNFVTSKNKSIKCR